MSTIQTRSKMDDKIHKNQFYFVANAQLFDNSESKKYYTFSSKSSDMLIKQLQFMLTNIANMISETFTIDS